MTWASRLKLTTGIIIIVLMVAVFTVIFTQRQSQVVSTSASIKAEEYQVGTDYSGTITRQYVREGDHVKKGAKLFQLSSMSVLQFANSKIKTFKNTAYSVTSDGTMTFYATVPGTVSKITTKAGSFVTGGANLATIDKAGSLFVVSDYALTPRDYERIQSGAKVDLMLPNQNIVAGTVKKITVQTLNNTAETEIEVSSRNLPEGSHAGLVVPGTPVTATLHLRQDGPFAGTEDSLSAFMRKIGL